MALEAIVCLGKHAWLQLTEEERLTNAVKAGTEVNVNSFIISKHLGWHGGVFEHEIPVLCAYHPSYILRKWHNKTDPSAGLVLRNYRETFARLKEKIHA